MTNSDLPPAILVVDDHPANQLAVEAVLEPLGYRVVGATSGEEALKRVAEQDFVLILMDVHMPGLDGYQTTALIRQFERARDIPIIFLTAVFNQPEHTYRGYALGAVDFISKPFDPEVLRGKVRALVLLYMRGQRSERERSQEVERIKDLFLGTVGHDLRSPLNAIILASQAMIHQGGAAHPLHARTIERAGKRMHRMIEDILDLTRGQFGRMSLSPKATDLGDVSRAVVEELKLANPARVLQLEVTGEVGGYWDPHRLARVVSNLLVNALEHGGDGPVHAGVRDAGERVLLEVHNGGTPIEPEAQRALFEPFRRGETGGAGGLGLGLYIVREIVRAHQGTIDVRSTSAEGTTFTVALSKASPASAVGPDIDISSG
jgi:two-component system sensor histidine kinase/response regulator